VILVALAVLLSTAVGVAGDRRYAWAPRAARGALGLMLYALLPFVSFVNFAHLRLSVGGGLGIALAYLSIGLAGAAVWAVGRRWMQLPRPVLGALICTVIVVNTGYLGLPMSLALLGARGLSAAIVYDQLVSGPMLLVFGFAVGAAFGSRGGARGRERVRAFVLRNPPLLAVVVGLLTPASAVPASLVQASHVVVIALLPLGFFTVGVNLSAERREDAAPLLELPDRRVVLAVAVRLLGPSLLLAALSALAVRLPSAYLLQAAMPTGINSLIVGHAYGLDQRLIATVIVWSTAAVLVVGLVAAAL
jgi:malate permease and related proteins